jgi:hypothetical protein
VKYRTIVADPPWPMPESGKRSGGNLGPADHCDHTGKWRKPEGTWWGTSSTSWSRSVRHRVLSFSPGVSGSAGTRGATRLWNTWSCRHDRAAHGMSQIGTQRTHKSMSRQKIHDSIRGRSANFSAAMTRSAEKRRCPKCQRKSALVRLPADYDRGFLAMTYCRWEDCAYERHHGDFA